MFYSISEKSLINFVPSEAMWHVAFIYELGMLAPESKTIVPNIAYHPNSFKR